MNFKIKIKYLIFSVLYFLKSYKLILNKYKKGVKNVFFLGSADYSNIGDLAISEATIIFLKRYGVNLIEVPLNSYYLFSLALRVSIKKNDVIILQGGGNLGDDYIDAEENRRKIIKTFKNNIKILFPSTIYFNNTAYGQKQLRITEKIYNRNGNLFLFAREKISFNKMNSVFYNCKVLESPDIVLYLSKLDFSFKNERKCIGICMRKDIESNAPNLHFSKDYNFIFFDNHTDSKKIFNERKDIVFNQLSFISHFKAVITDRLHIMIFCYITKTPCLIFDNKTKKNSEIYQQIKDCGFIYYDYDINDFLQIVENNKVSFKNLNFNFLNLEYIIKAYV